MKAVLDGFLGVAEQAQHAARLVREDPVELVRAFSDPHDQEVAGILVAMLAYGRVAAIREKATRALTLLGSSPARAVDSGAASAALDGFVYRFQRGRDLPRFLEAVRAARREHQSLGGLFFSVAEGDGEPDYAAAMDRFVSVLEAKVEGRMSRGLRFLLPRTGNGGAAKRLCLYLRWMIRPAGVFDLGAWQRLAPGVETSRLLIPLDTHVFRIARNLGLTARKTGDLAASREITAHLRALRPEDPVAYDMALCHLGISGSCPKDRDPSRCALCALRQVCCVA